MLLFIHGLGSRVQALETTDLVECGVITEKRRTPEDTREHHAQYNRQTTASRQSAKQAVYCLWCRECGAMSETLSASYHRAAVRDPSRY